MNTLPFPIPKGSWVPPVCPNCGTENKKDLSGPFLYKQGNRGLDDIIKDICVHNWHNIISEPIRHDLPGKSFFLHSSPDHKQ